MFGDVLHDPVRYQVPNRMPPLHPAATISGRYRQRRNFEPAYVVLRKVGKRHGVSRPTDRDEMCKVPKTLNVLPAEDLLDGIGTRDEEEVAVWAFPLNVAQRVDRVRGTAPVDVHAGHREPRVRRGRDDRHQVAVLGWADAPLLPRLVGRDEDDLVQ